MKFCKRLFTFLSLFVALVGILAIPASAAEYTNVLTNIYNKVAEINTSLNNVESDVDDIRIKTSNIYTAIDSIKTNISSLKTAVDNVNKTVTSAYTTLQSIDKKLSSLSDVSSMKDMYTLVTSSWSSTGGTSSLQRSSWFGYTLDRLVSINSNLSSSNSHLTNLESNSDTLVSLVGGISSDLASSLLIGAGTDGYGLLDAMTDLGANKPDAPYSYLSALVYRDSESGEYQSYLGDIALSSSYISQYTAQLGIDVSNMRSTLGLVRDSVADIVSYSALIKAATENIYMESQGIHSDTTGIYTDTTGIHTDTTSIDSTVKNIKIDTGNIDITTDHISTTLDDFSDEFLNGLHSVVDYDGNNAVSSFSSAGSSDFMVYFSPRSYFRLRYSARTKTANNSALNSSVLMPAGTYILTNLGLHFRYIDSTGSDMIASCQFGKSQTHHFSRDFYITGFRLESSTTLAAGNYDFSFVGPIATRGTNGLLEVIANKISQLQYVVADKESLALKQENKPVSDQAATDFFSGSDSSTSLGTGGLGNLKGAGDQVGSRLDPGVSAGDLGSALDGVYSDEGGLSWFTSATANDLDTVPVTYSRDASDQIVTDYVGQYELEVLGWLNSRGDDDADAG